MIGIIHNSKMSDLSKEISKDLPNFPEDIVEQWKDHFDEWPPIEPWVGPLVSRPVAYWQNVIWRVELIKAEELIKETACASTINQIIMHHTTGERNLYSSIMSTDNKARFDSILTYIFKHGNLPRKPIAIKVNDFFEISDGMHRIAAYILYTHPWYSRIKEKYLKDYVTTFVPAKDEIQVWIGIPHTK